MSGISKCVIAMAAATCLAGAKAAEADVTRVFWMEVVVGPSPRPAGVRTFDLYAEVTSGTRVVSVDLGDTSINLPPGGQNTGIKIVGGSMRQAGAVFTTNEVTPGAAKLATDPLLAWDTYAALGQLSDAQVGLIRPVRSAAVSGVDTVTGTWFDVPLDGVDSAANPLCSGNRVRLVRLSVDAAAANLGGDAGTVAQPNPSRVFVYWDTGVTDGGHVLAVSNAMTTACRADFSADGCTSVEDIFQYLNLYFTGDPRADVDGSGTATVQDIFDFLGAFFAC